MYSSELAVHARTPQRSKRSCFSLTERTPSVSTLFGKKARRRSPNTKYRDPPQAIPTSPEWVQGRYKGPWRYY